MRENSPVKECIQPNGGLFSLGWYLSWTPGYDTATLDGAFTAEDLREIADFMEQ